MNILIYTEENRLGTADIPPFIVGDPTTWTLQFQNADGAFYSPAAVTMNLGHINGLPDGTYTNAFKWVDRCGNEHVASIVVTAGVPAVTWDTQPVGGMVGDDGVYVVRGQIPDGRITGLVSNDLTIERTKGDLPPATPTRFTFSEDAGGAGATGNIHWELKKYILRVTITDGGTGYTSAPTVVFTGGGGDHAAATATISDCGSVVDIKVTDNGCSYTSAPTISFTGGEGSGAAAACEWIDSDGQAGITSIQVKTSGAGYSSAPTVAITDSLSTGSGAEAVALGWDSVSSIVIADQGTGYTSNPTIAIDPPSSGETATAEITGHGIITRAEFTGSGSMSTYLKPERNSLRLSFGFTGGGGTGAAGVARFISQANTVAPPVLASPAGGYSGSIASYDYPTTYKWVLVGVDITNPGTGYTSDPTANIYGYNITGKSTFTAKITNPGTGYTSTPGYTISGGGGSGMTATLATGKVTAIAITNPGQDYTSPIVTITGGSTNATAVANVDGRMRYGVKYAEITSQGNGYTAIPYVAGNVTDTGKNDIGSISRFIESVQTGIERSELPYKRAESSALVMGSVRMSGFSDGRYSASGQLQYDHSALIVRPRSIAAAKGLASCAAHGIRFTGTSWNQVLTITFYHTEGGGVVSYDSYGTSLDLFGDSTLTLQEVIDNINTSGVVTAALDTGAVGTTAIGVLEGTDVSLVSGTETLTAGTDSSGNPILSGTMNPINDYVTARLAVRRSTTLDLQVFGDGRMLFQGALTIIQKIQ